MKAIIMAGGEGTRLRPLTCDCPKPMMQLMNRPVMEYAVGLLKSHGITDIAVTLGYLPDAVTDYFSDGADFGVSLKYYIERTPMGTAGGVGQARDFLDETFIVLSGDGVTDLDITSALAFHRRKNALATLVLREVDNPLEYGVAMTDDDGRITGFIEKPDPSNVFSSAVNTGIYILEPGIFDFIPEGQAHDFGGELFPELVRRGEPVFGYVMDGYWCDIGDVAAYLAAHIHAMEGRVRLPAFNESASVHPDAMIDPAAILEYPCVIGAGARIGAHARIGMGSVIGPGCVIEEHADIKRSILWQGVRLDPGAQARGCVLASGSRMGQDAQAYEGSVIGAGACLSDRSILLPGIKLWPGKQTAPGERVESNLIWGGARRQLFIGGALPVTQPTHTMLATQAYASVFRPRIMLIGRTDHPIANVMWHAAAAGAMAQGVQVMDAGECTLPVFRHAMKTLGCDGGVLITPDLFIPLQQTGAYLVSRQQRSLLALYARQDFPAPFSAGPLPVLAAGSPMLAYIADACRCFTADPAESPRILLSCPDSRLFAVAAEAITRIGLEVKRVSDDSSPNPGEDELSVHLDPDGETFLISDSDGPLTETQQQLFLAWIAAKTESGPLALPVSATRAIEVFAARHGIRAEYVGSEPLAWQDKLAREFPARFTLYSDALFAALSGISHLVSDGITLRDWRSSVPRTCRIKRTVPAPPESAGRILEHFSKSVAGADPGCGVRFSKNGGWAWVCPEEDLTGFRVVTESVSAETATELCDFCEKEITDHIKK